MNEHTIASTEEWKFGLEGTFLSYDQLPALVSLAWIWGDYPRKCIGRR